MYLALLRHFTSAQLGVPALIADSAYRESSAEEFAESTGWIDHAHLSVCSPSAAASSAAHRDCNSDNSGVLRNVGVFFYRERRARDTRWALDFVLNDVRRQKDIDLLSRRGRRSFDSFDDIFFELRESCSSRGFRFSRGPGFLEIASTALRVKVFAPGRWPPLKIDVEFSSVCEGPSRRLDIDRILPGFEYYLLISKQDDWLLFCDSVCGVLDYFETSSRSAGLRGQVLPFSSPHG